MKSRRLANLPIKQKLVAIIMATTTLTLLVTLATVAILELRHMRASKPQEIKVLAKIIADNSPVFLEFDYVREAEKTLLASLAAKQEIVAAALYRTNGTLFASYRRADQPDHEIPTGSGKIGYKFSGKALKLFCPVESQDEVVGTLYLESDLQEMHALLRELAVSTLLILLFASAIAGIITLKLQKFITSPILELAQVTTQVADKQNYSVG